MNKGGHVGALAKALQKAFEESEDQNGWNDVARTALSEVRKLPVPRTPGDMLQDALMHHGMHPDGDCEAAASEFLSLYRAEIGEP